jgi:hypothetical protein
VVKSGNVTGNLRGLKVNTIMAAKDHSWVGVNAIERGERREILPQCLVISARNKLNYPIRL